jgi:6-phosphogluconolactonase
MAVHILSSLSLLGEKAAEQVTRLSAEAVAGRGRFTVALSGGSLPKLLGPALLAEPLRSQIDWQAWHVFWADERCVPLSDPESNYRLAQEYLLQHAAIPAAQIYPIDDKLDPTAAASAYEARLRQLFTEASDFPRFDLILLGLGEDGHTASLFPNHPLLQENNRWVAPVFDSPKPPPERITLTLPVLNNARQVSFMAAGAGKAEVLPQLVGEAASTPALPARRVCPTNGGLDWFLDEAAAARLLF